ncbi:CNNM domain-containing protein [Mesomycoplasma conjunctivae]|uniref:CNNM domain-containing protein n=1 Tax=Mesomycoplasma conjunctivae TaxID=45361 RepID=UPI0023E4415F|nr:CNNM domain-containing protein [Mesomycoplasma conjunctivae]
MLFILSAFFSASETVFTATSRAKIETNLPDLFIGKKFILKYYDNYERTLTVILIWNNIFNIGISIIISVLFATLQINESLQILISILATTPPLILFSELYPKILGKHKPILFLKIFWVVLTFFYYLSYPIAILITKFIKTSKITHTENELKKIILQGQREGVLEKEESDLVIRALDFDSFKTEKYFTKLSDVVYVDYEDSFEHICDKIIDSNFSRIPVWKKDTFVGILLAKDILHLNEFSIDDYIIEVPLLPSTSLIKTNYEILKRSKSQMGFVTSSLANKKIIGILTFEDILECLFGPIYDEYDYRDNLEIYELSSNQIIAYSTTSISAINKALNIELSTSFSTLQDWLNANSKTKIVKGSTVLSNFNNYKLEFKIFNKSNKVMEVKIAKIEVEQDN